MPTGRTGELVSVVMPSYNHARFLPEAVRSVFAQTWRPLELVVVDDGSTDESLDVLRELAAEAPLPVTVLAQGNGGAHTALNRGCAAAAGRLLAILNSDDVYEPRRLEELVPRLGSSRDAMAFSGVAFVDEHGALLPAGSAWPSWYETALAAAWRSPSLGFALLQANFSVSSSNFLFTRRLFDRLGGFAGFRFLHDWDFLIRATFYTEPAFTPQPLFRYRVHAAGTTESVRNLLGEEGRAALRRYLDLLASHRPPPSPPPNPLAAGPATWPTLWPRFAQQTKPFFSPLPLAELAVSARP
jgi:glycosyltransferase involved in cell wall biosynthesis